MNIFPPQRLKSSGMAQPEKQGLVSNFRLSISTWLTTSILLITLIPVIVISMANFIVAQRTLTDQSAFEVAQETERAGLIIEAYLSQFPQDLLLLSNAYPVEVLFFSIESENANSISSYNYFFWARRLEQNFASVAGVKPAYQQIRLLNANGQEVVRVDSYDDEIHFPQVDKLINSGEAEYFRIAKDLQPGDIYISPITINQDYQDLPQFEEQILRMTTPIYDQIGRFKGVLTTNIKLSAIAERVQDVADGKFFLAGSDGYYLFEIEEDDSIIFYNEPQNNLLSDFPRLATNVNGEQGEKNPPYYFDSGKNRYVSFKEIKLDSTIPYQSWKLIYTISEDQLLNSTLFSRLLPYLGFGLLATTIAIICGIALSRIISNPIVSVSRAAAELAEASTNRDASQLPRSMIEVKRGDELGELAHSFNQMTIGLGNLYQTLEQRIHAQLNLLDMLTTSGQISEQITTILDQSELVETILPLLKEKYNLYHAAVLLLDENGTKLNFAYGSDERARQLKESRESIPLRHPSSLIARAAQAEAFVLVNDVSTEPNYLPHPLITETKSELAIPLMVHNRLIGVLDIQENQTNRFREEDVSLFVSIGRQLAIAINNAQLFERHEEVGRRLTTALEKAVQSDKAKDAFLARVSHELRTPLGVILGYAEMMQDEMYGDINVEQHERLDDIIHSSSHLTELVNQLLDSAKLDSGKIVAIHKPFEVYDLIHAVTKQMDALAKRKGLSLKVKYARTLPRYIESDATLIRQMLINLIGNAIKFTDKGEVVLGVVHKDDNWMSLIVKDTGIGIPSSIQNEIFEPFRQADDSITRTHGGTGLGLAITKRIAEILGGSISLISREGVGSQFTITLPLVVVEQPDYAPDQLSQAEHEQHQAFEPVKTGQLPEFETGSELEPIILSRNTHNSFN